MAHVARKHDLDSSVKQGFDGSTRQSPNRDNISSYLITPESETGHDFSSESIDQSKPTTAESVNNTSDFILCSPGGRGSAQPLFSEEQPLPSYTATTLPELVKLLSALWPFYEPRNGREYRIVQADNTWKLDILAEVASRMPRLSKPGTAVQRDTASSARSRTRTNIRASARTPLPSRRAALPSETNPRSRRRTSGPSAASLEPNVEGNRVQKRKRSRTPEDGTPKFTRKAKGAAPPQDNDFTTYDDYTPCTDGLSATAFDAFKGKDGNPKELSSDRHKHLLEPAEIVLAQNLRLTGAQYLTCKRRFFITLVKGLEADPNYKFIKTKAQGSCKIDVNKSSTLFVAWDSVGWFDHSLEFFHERERINAARPRHQSISA